MTNDDERSQVRGGRGPRMTYNIHLNSPANIKLLARWHKIQIEYIVQGAWVRGSPDQSSEPGHAWQ